MPITGNATPVGGGTMPNYSRAGSDGSFIPEVWSGKMIEKLYDATVLAAISNTDYEGEIKQQGDTVMIRQEADITVSDYERGMELPIQRPTSSRIELQINKAKYFNAAADDADVVQADVDLLNKWGTTASQKMKISVDTSVLADLVDDADAANRGATAGVVSGDINLGVTATPFALTKTTVLDYLVDMGLVLDEQNVPEEGRFIVLPAWACAAIKKSDLKDASITGDGTSVLRNGRVGVVDRFTIYSSNLLPKSSGKYTVFAGHPMALTFAAQLTKTEKLRSERTFGDLIRGLFIYGYKVVQPKALAQGVIAKS